jgi:hypothetical protein
LPEGYLSVMAIYERPEDTYIVWNSAKSLLEKWTREGVRRYGPYPLEQKDRIAVCNKLSIPLYIAE